MSWNIELFFIFPKFLFKDYNKIYPLINNNKRICKTPFKKWYIKGYTNKSDNHNRGIPAS